MDTTPVKEVLRDFINEKLGDDVPTIDNVISQLENTAKLLTVFVMAQANETEESILAPLAEQLYGAACMVCSKQCAGRHTTYLGDV